VLEVLCCDTKALYDKEKAERRNIAIADVVGAPVSQDWVGNRDNLQLFRVRVLKQCVSLYFIVYVLYSVSEMCGHYVHSDIDQ
jgi:hypothetical protein